MRLIKYIFWASWIPVVAYGVNYTMQADRHGSRTLQDWVVYHNQPLSPADRLLYIVVRILFIAIALVFVSQWEGVMKRLWENSILFLAAAATFYAMFIPHRLTVAQLQVATWVGAVFVVLGGLYIVVLRPMWFSVYRAGKKG